MLGAGLGAIYGFSQPKAKEAAFAQGFMDKCAQYGVDPSLVATAAQAVAPQVKVNDDEAAIEELWDDEDTAQARYPNVYQKIVERKRMNGPKYTPPVQNQL